LSLQPPSCSLSPKFLHTNSTSHTWPFSAIAELIDNAYDPDVSAKRFWIDKTVVKDEVCLSFMDNGNGLDHETMHKMLSFGYSDKIALNGLEPIGIYGNGFKSGSMRLGKDAIVFSKSKTVSCIGMLSQTYLEMIDAKQIIVLCHLFSLTISLLSVNEDQEASLRDILQYSLFKSQVELLAEIDAISSSTAKTGTRIIIWNLRRTSTGSTEFDFGTDRYDIRIPSEVYEELSDPSQPLNRATSYVPESVVSLRAYCSILYLKPRMQVMVRGQKVKSQLIAKSLAYIRKDYYKPMFLEKRIPIIFGYNTKSKDHYGIMMYHKNRLIKAYERVGCQLKANKKGVGVIGVIECNFLDPTHNKQSFIESDKYRKTINSLGVKLEEYWNEIRYRKTKEDPNSTVPVEDTMKRPDQNWVQCDTCLRWRKLPDGIDVSKLPDKWFCHMNPDPQFRGKRGTVAIQQGPPKRPRMNGFQPSSSDTPPAGNTSPVSVHTDSSETDDSDDDLVILEKESTPKPQKAARNLPKVKQEKEDGESEITVLLECTDDAAVEEPSEETDPAAASCPPSGVASATTQTKAPEVKEEKENLNKPEGKDGAAGGKVQKQQDKLLELMHGTAQERDSLKEQVKNLRSQLQELQSRLKQLSQASVKKECSHQACQTEDERDYKCLFEKAKQKINDLIKDKEALLATRESKTTINAGQDEEKDIEEISHQVSCLVRELDQSNKERDELRLQFIISPLLLSNLLCSLIELRQNVGRLLISRVPALDLQQVNYECTVIDEILEQYLMGQTTND
uniref:MORC family CW-type zinc finger 3a n=1 Tax=Cyprinodon variegatus TaxID=28743 RepID=A0A3Q2CT21_CYPVA